MSKFSLSELKNHSFSPQYLSQGTADSSALFEKHREVIRQQVSELPNSPKSKSKIEKTLEEMLKSIHYFRKPDIIPYPSLSLKEIPQDVPWEQKYQELLVLFEKEKKEKKMLAKENESLRLRVSSLLDLETQYNEYRVKSMKLPELNSEVETLNTRINILLDENDELRRRIKSNENSLSFSKDRDELIREKRKNEELRRNISQLQIAYEDLRNEREIKEIKLREKSDFVKKDRDEKPQRTVKSLDDDIQSKIRNMKQEYKDKLKNLEQRIECDKVSAVPEKKLREIESRLELIQGKILERENTARRSERNNQVTPRKQRSPLQTERLTPSNSKRRKSPLLESRSQKTLTPKKDFKEIKDRKGTLGSKSPSSPRHHGHSSRSRSPGTKKSPSRQGCQTCLKRHGHDWAE
jgi:hypothetical protein